MVFTYILTHVHIFNYEKNSSLIISNMYIIYYVTFWMAQAVVVQVGYKATGIFFLHWKYDFLFCNPPFYIWTKDKSLSCHLRKKEGILPTKQILVSTVLPTYCKPCFWNVIFFFRLLRSKIILKALFLWKEFNASYLLQMIKYKYSC